jgi:hypothetical protein
MSRKKLVGNNDTWELVVWSDVLGVFVDVVDLQGGM